MSRVRTVRHGKSFVLPLAGIIATVILLAWLFIPKPKSAYGRETIVIASDPVYVLSWNRNDKSFTTFTFPNDIVAEGTHGYGTYSLDAFWRLGEIDKKDGTVLAESMSELLGIPVTGYIGLKTGVLSGSPFTLGSILTYLSRGFRTNISFPSFLGYVWMLGAAKPAHVAAFDFARDVLQITAQQILPDGSRQLVIDTSRLDSVLKHVFEDDSVRREGVTVAVYNTTDMPSLGDRAARLLGHIGVSVVAVGNDTPETDVCTLTGTKGALKSVSARVITSVLGCVTHTTSEAGRADIVVRIGKSYARRFLPN